MKDQRNSRELQFYLDRSIDSLVMIIRSILENPNIQQSDRVQSLTRIANHHSSLALMLQTKLHGEDVAISLFKPENKQ